MNQDFSLYCFHKRRVCQSALSTDNYKLWQSHVYWVSHKELLVFHGRVHCGQRYSAACTTWPAQEFHLPLIKEVYLQWKQIRIKFLLHLDLGLGFGFHKNKSRLHSPPRANVTTSYTESHCAASRGVFLHSVSFVSPWFTFIYIRLLTRILA